MNQRLNVLNSHFENQEASSKGTKPKGKVTSDVWESMGLDRLIRPEIVEKRKATGKMMKSVDLKKDFNDTTMPFWMVPKI
jgi:hypothetical protein